MSQPSSNRAFLLGSIVGAVIGGAAALLLAPKSGRELRGNITDGVQQARKGTQQMLRNLDLIDHKPAAWIDITPQRASQSANADNGRK
ncbi:YtxH domain-containing protein [Paenibacillus sp. UMB4589-SE434]|uniref:YtxH domain-containing protein n=1 Tax=Paenibacillus sp. UMB4589-SE434 TaxID=3046314 RepID=UPI002550CD05|nr:YtxH domain-containing protein [Paenibacillus sp. UMB4589-SE434]MDK8182836.1 YtxH domain-containing protein [Paenibacillus sp. UMB4589-SE434]